MELWIRSQDKEKLLKVNDIAIEMNMIYGYFDKNTEYEHLGSYVSRERALEVLDEIQNILMPRIEYIQNEPIEKCELSNITTQKLMYIRTQNSDVKVLEFPTYVYEMPEE